MKSKLHLTLYLSRNKGGLVAFFPLLQRGVLLKSLVGCSVRNLLCKQLGVADDYLTNRIQTIILDGKPVDDENTATVHDGSVLALSIALGGAFGASFRKAGLVAGFRSSITHREENRPPATSFEGALTIKLFNQVAEELGPVLLNKGIGIDKEAAFTTFKQRFDKLRSYILNVEKNGQEIPPEQLAALNWSEAPEQIFLNVIYKDEQDEGI